MEQFIEDHLLRPQAAEVRGLVFGGRKCSFLGATQRCLLPPRPNTPPLPPPSHLHTQVKQAADLFSRVRRSGPGHGVVHIDIELQRRYGCGLEGRNGNNNGDGAGRG